MRLQWSPTPGAAASIFSGNQIIAVKVNGGTFSNGTPWKCLTCGIPAANRPGLSDNAGGAGGYPQAFRDGHRLMQGNSIYECDEPLVSDACTPANTHRYAITWVGGAIRENKIVADDVHLGFSHVNVTGVSRLQQFGYMGRLVFKAAPPTGNPRYELENVTRLHPHDQFEFAAAPVWPDPNNPGELLVNSFSNSLGELKDWSKDGKWVAAIPYPAESSNPDVTLINMETGEVRRIARAPDYSEVLDVSYDNEWAVLLETRGESGTRFGTGKELFFSAMPGIPPVTDLVQTTGMIASVRSHYRPAPHADFTPILVDLHGDRGSYVGQALKAPSSCPDGFQPGNLCDGVNWNTTSEAWWTPDSTKIIYKEQNFGGAATSLEPGARNSRLVIVRLTDRQPKPYTPPAPISDVVPWATPYTPGDPEPWRENNAPPAGTYTVQGTVFGSAQVTIQQNVSGPQPLTSEVAISYDNFSYDGLNVINGNERVTLLTSQANIFAPALEWESDLALSGCDEGTKVSNEGGYRIRTNVLAPTGSMRATGSFITTINGESWVNPPFLPY